MQKGIIDRFRSLPMSRSSMLLGRTASDVLLNALSVTVMSLTGLVVGWRIRGSFLEAVAGFALLLLFSYAISWIFAYIGPHRADAGGRAERLVRRPVPGDVHRQHVRADERLPDGACGRSPTGTPSQR
jgi:hypothetical protein